MLQSHGFLDQRLSYSAIGLSPEQQEPAELGRLKLIGA
jgi:hypothetical protein